MIALANRLLQSTRFAAAVGLLALAFGRNHARTRHSLWMAASVKFLVPFSLLVSLSSRIAPVNAPAAPPPQLRFVMAEFRQSVTPSAAPTSTDAPPARPDSWPNAAWALWLCGSAAILIRWRLRWRNIAVAGHGARPVSDVVEQAFVGGALAILGRRRSRAKTEARSHEHQTIPDGSVSCGRNRRIARRREPAKSRVQPRLAAPQEAEPRGRPVRHDEMRFDRRGALLSLASSAFSGLFCCSRRASKSGSPRRSARLVEERELACDEEVLQLGADPEIYAESILKICE